jgi:hypothetical protein
MAEQRLKVVGPFVTHGVAPGGTFLAGEVGISEAEVELMVQQGAVEVVPLGKTQNAAAQEAADKAAADKAAAEKAADAAPTDETKE